MRWGLGLPLWASFLLVVAFYLAKYALQNVEEGLRDQETTLTQLTQEIQTHLESQHALPITEEKISERILTQSITDSNKVSAEDSVWFEKVVLKMNCLTKLKQGTTFFYHTRKAGGTTIHDWLSILSSQWQVPYLELEGKSLNPLLLREQGVLSITSLRNPIDRILSLYWYEHVAWWYDVKHEPQNCRTLAQWVDGWRDGSPWKAHFVRQNPGTVYVEVQNYYVKSFIGWNGLAPIGEADLERAKNILSEDFDFVLMTDDMSSDSFGSLSLLSKLFGSSTQALKQKSNKSDQSMRQRLESQLAKDQVWCRPRPLSDPLRFPSLRRRSSRASRS
jgi:hypothetical protein